MGYNRTVRFSVPISYNQTVRYRPTSSRHSMTEAGDESGQTRTLIAIFRKRSFLGVVRGAGLLTERRGQSMKHFLLIHGSWHGAWCWYKIAPLLEAEGHSVSAPDLPGRICSPARPISVSLKKMVRAVSHYLPREKKTTIVVHSRYGILASMLAETFPERIERVIYLASYMIPSGKRAAEYFRWDKGSYLTEHVTISKAGMWDRLHSDIFREGLYHDCNEHDNKLGHMLLGREPLRPALAKLKLTDERFGQIPRAYIRLTEDRAVTPALQDRVLNETSVDRVESLAASHSAYFSQPDALTRLIQNLSKS